MDEEIYSMPKSRYVKRNYSSFFKTQEDSQKIKDKSPHFERERYLILMSGDYKQLRDRCKEKGYKAAKKKP